MKRLAVFHRKHDRTSRFFSRFIVVAPTAYRLLAGRRRQARRRRADGGVAVGGGDVTARGRETDTPGNNFLSGLRRFEVAWLIGTFVAG